MLQANLEAIDLELEERRSQHSHAIGRSTSRDSTESSKASFVLSYPPSASYPPKEKEDIGCEAPYSVSFPPTNTVNYLHGQDDYPDGGLRAWLVVLGVRSWILVCGLR